MRTVERLEPAVAAPAREVVLASQGVPPDPPPAHIAELVERAFARYLDLAEPKAVWRDVSHAEFAAIYDGEGRNEARTPVAEAAATADRLALFAVTLGAPVSEEITGLFAARDLALGAMLDAVASEAADRCVTLAARRFAGLGPGPAVLPYSPGYCGWHITGQRALFARLEPADIGITLNASCLMQPLKSVSGVLVAGDPGIHDIEPGFPACVLCTDQACRGRIERVRAEV